MMHGRNPSFELSRRQFGLGAGAAVGASLLLPQMSFAQADYPNRTVTIVAPAAAGGPTDIIGRTSAQKLTERLKQNFIVENKGGAAGNLGAQVVSKAAPDGYTLMVFLAPLAQNIAIFKQPGFAIEDFTPVAHMASVDLVMAARKDLPCNTLDEFLVYTKTNKISCGSQSPPQMEYLKRTTKIDFTVAPYKGSALIVNDLVGGNIDIGLAPYSDVAQQLAAGNLKVLFTNGPKRVRQLPNVQAVGERFPGFYFWSWYGIAAPAKTPEPIVQKLRTELVDVAKSPDFLAFLDKLGLAPADHPEKFGDVINNEVAQWKRLVTELSLPQL
jgi:tripartite-type tricarboxylate transporter receptor subunit TctC